MLSRPEFVAAPRQQAFLKFVVDETLAERSSRLKAFTIATSVFGRNETFDPQKNSIVRVEALRLRRMLDNYYDGVGLNDPVQIRLRRGAYVPEFTHNPVVQPVTRNEVSPPSPPPLARWTWAIAVSVAAISVGLMTLVYRSGVAVRATLQSAAVSSPPRHPTISIAPFALRSPSPSSETLAVALRHDIEDKLSLFDDPRVIESDATNVSADYRLSGVLSDSDGGADLAVRITRLETGKAGEIIWSKRYGGYPAGVGSILEPGSPASIALAIGQSYGAIHADVRRRLAGAPGIRTGYDCVVRAYEAFDAPSPQRFDEAEACLTTVLASDPDFASGAAALSLLQVSRWLDGVDPSQGPETLRRASSLARAAARLSPMKARMHVAKFWARFFSGRYDDAFDSARVALQLNPHAVDARARIGAAHVLRGRVAEGRRLLSESERDAAMSPSWVDFFQFLAAWLDGDGARARLYASRSATFLSPLGLVAHIVVAQQSGELGAAREARAELDRKFPTFSADLRASFDRWSMTPDIRDRLLAAVGPELSAARRTDL